jgi:hypothetical protein
MIFRKARSWFRPLLALAVVGCQAQHPQLLPKPLVERRGVSSVHVLPRDTPATPASSNIEVVAASPQGESAPPGYPTEALSAGAGDVSVVVRIVVDETGSVREIRDSPVMKSTAGPFAAAFRDAVERTVKVWRFAPAERRVFENGPDRDGDGEPDFFRMTSATPIAMYFDLRFDFSIVEGKPHVDLK